MPEITTQPHNGLDLRASAVRKIEQARTILDSARHDLCNLEGDGYCNQYDKVGTLEQTLGQVASRLRDMKPPTGVFQV